MAIYWGAANAAYQNSLSLLEDANLLEQGGRHARAYALAELSLEEFAKAFLYRCYAAGLIKDPDFHRDLNLHREKLFHAIHIMAATDLLVRLRETIINDAKTKDHSKHILSQKLDDPATLQRIDEVIDLLKVAHRARLRGLYVEVLPKSGELRVPRDVEWKNQTEKLLEFMNTYAHLFGTVLKDDDTSFVEMVDLIDPQVMSGTIKSDLDKFRGRKKW